MYYTQKLDILKKALILSLFFLCIPTIFIFLFYNNSSGLSTFFKEYFISGKSLFFPSLPYKNILWFLPKEAQFIQFSTGHLIDIILIMNLIAFVEWTGYHYYVKVCLNKNYLEQFIQGSEEHTYYLTQEQDIFFDLKEEPRLILEEGFLNIKFNKNQRLTEKTEVFHEYMTKEEYRCKIIEREILSQKSSRYRNKVSQVFCYQSSNDKLSNTLLINQTLYPQINYITDSTKPIQQEG